MATTTDYLNKLIEQKNTLADNLVTKGVTATHDETLDTLVPKMPLSIMYFIARL